MARFVRDFLSSGRILRRNPGFALVAIVTLAISIGALTSVFSVVNTILLRPLPYPIPDNRLVAISESWAGTTTWGVAYPNFLDWRKQADLFEEMAAYGYIDMNIADRGSAQHLLGMRVSSNFFDTLGVKPLLGRGFATGETGTQQVAMISHAFWKKHFASDPNCIGKQIAVNARSFTIIGVLPPNFKFYWSSDVYVPIGSSESGADLADRNEHGSFYVLGRLKRGAGIVQARMQMSTIAGRLAATYPSSNEGHSVALSGLRQNMEKMVATWKPVSLVLMAGAVCLLLLTCSNLANLLLARLVGRRREIAIRTAVGATSGKLFFQFLTENMSIVVISAAVALPLSAIVTPQLVRLIAEPDLFPFIAASLDWRIFLFALVVSLIAAIACTLPGIHFLREQSPQTLLRSSDSATAMSRQGVYTQQVLVMIEVALAFALAVNTTVLMHTLQSLYETRLTFDGQKLLTLRLPASSPEIDWRALSAFDRDLLQSVEHVPGVRAAAIAFPVPFSRDKSIDNFTVVGRHVPPARELPEANFHQVSSDYFRVVGISLLQGRGFAQTDYQDHAPCVVIVNHTAVKTFWNGNDPVGTQISLGPSPNGKHCSIVGVVADVKEYKLGLQPENEIYLASYGGEGLLVSGYISADAIKPSILNQIHSINPMQPVYDVASMEQRLSDSVRKERSVAELIFAFACAAMLVAAAGIFGVVAQFVSQRAREIGIRLAMGASRPDLLYAVVRRAMMPVIPGTVIGLALSFWSSRAAEALLFNMRQIYPVSFFGIAGVLIAVTMMACYVPARRALKIDPARVLRES